MQEHNKKGPGPGAAIEVITVSPFMMNSMLVYCRNTMKAAVVDPGDEAPRLLARAKALKLDITHILLTHGHIDHIAATGDVKAATGATIHLHRDELALYDRLADQARAFGLPSVRALPAVDVFVADGDTIALGELACTVFHTPGHSPGSVCYVFERIEGSADPLLRDGFVLSGDVLFAGSIGRTDLWGGSYGTLMKSIGRQLMPLPDETRIYSGHGPVTTIGRERRSNPFAHDFKTHLL